MPAYLLKPRTPQLRPDGYPRPGKLLLACPFATAAGLTAFDRSGCGRHGTTIGGAWGYGPRGEVRSHTATTDRVDFGNSSWLPTQGVTIILAYRKRDATVRVAAAFGINSTAAFYCGAFLPYSDGKVYWDFGGTTENATRVSVAGLTVSSTQEDVWAFTTGPRGMEIWQNGVKVASNSANPSRSSTTASFMLGLHDSTFNTSDFADYGALLVLGEQVTAAEIRRLSLDPHAYFRPPGRAWLDAATAPAPAAGAYKVWYAGAGRGSILGGGVL